LVISTEQIHARTTTELCRPALRTLLQIGDEGLPSQTIVAQNGGDRPASTESWPGVSKVTHAGQSSKAATRGNGNVDLDKLLKRDWDLCSKAYVHEGWIIQINKLLYIKTQVSH